MVLDTEYSITDLVSRFSEQAELVALQNEQMADNYLSMNPDGPLPHHLMSPFNLAQALYVMCIEVDRLKRQLREHIINEHPFR